MLVLVIHQAVHVPTINNNFLCPMKVQMNDIKLNDTPKFLIENPTNTSHAITATDSEGNDVIIPLSLQNMISCSPTRKPTQEEFDTCPCVTFIYDPPIWDLHSERFHEQKDALLDCNGILLDHTQAMRGWKMWFISVFDTSAATL